MSVPNVEVLVQFRSTEHGVRIRMGRAARLRENRRQRGFDPQTMSVQEWSDRFVAQQTEDPPELDGTVEAVRITLADQYFVDPNFLDTFQEREFYEGLQRRNPPPVEIRSQPRPELDPNAFGWPD